MNKILAPLLFLNNLFLIGYCILIPLKSYNVIIILSSILLTVVLTIINNSVETTFNKYLRNMNKETIKSLLLDLSRFRVLLGIPLFYPVVETFFGISCFFWEPIRRFASTLPYCFNPNIRDGFDLFCWICFNIFVFIIMAIIPHIDSEFKHIGPILSLGLLYLFFDQQSFDYIIALSGFIIGGALILIFLIGSAAGGCSTSCDSFDKPLNNSTNTNSNDIHEFYKNKTEVQQKEYRERCEQQRREREERKIQSNKEQEERHKICSVKQSGNIIYVYNSLGHILFTKQGTCIGYTADTISVYPLNSNHTYVYNNKGQLMYTR